MSGNLRCSTEILRNKDLCNKPRIYLQHYHFILESAKIFVNNSKTILHPNKTAIITSPIAFNIHPKCLTFKWLKIADNATYNPGNLTVSFIKSNETEDAWIDNYQDLIKGNPKRLVPWNVALVDLPRKQEFKVKTSTTWTLFLVLRVDLTKG